MDARYVPMQTAEGNPLLASSCAGIAHGVQPGLLIQEFMARNHFRDSSAESACYSAKQFFCLLPSDFSLESCVLGLDCPISPNVQNV